MKNLKRHLLIGVIYATLIIVAAILLKVNLDYNVLTLLFVSGVVSRVLDKVIPDAV